MAIRTTLKYPDPGLSTACEPVTVFDARLTALAHDLLDTMRAAPGVGITAAHIGVFTRLVVLELSKQTGPRFYANPEILVASDELMRHTEGSVSMPGANDEVERPKSIRFRYQDLDGAVHEEEAEGFYSICMQHEVDQLDGIFWLKRLSRLKRDRLLRKWDKGK
ncbi:peptide deformylase [Neorhizobium galegae]|uniref:peptide deformylase n=1 Tax=Neorhizobium galegae TaxID=399 RepID=UPI00062192D1|nr:peptide deformylase [Neorhizobium galegae]MCQ1765227.1 peptide deformylase [Neorhizobium galegae]MCQ1844140.1 peptide deformylase [Neorhizobium galegae]CDZ33641.1 Peptide deformylase 2 [Neorhizobium galegae bv. officinalis]